MITNISLKFDTFTAPRLTEIQTNTDIESWYWVDTSDNPSDLGTRGKMTVKDLDAGSMWREGPAWLKQPSSTWPLRSDFKKHNVPGLKKEFEILKFASNITELMVVNDIIKEEEKPEVTTNANAARDEGENICNYPDLESEVNIANEIDHSRYSSWHKLIDVSAQVLIAGYMLLNNFKLGVKVIPSYLEAKKKVKEMWFKSMMKETKKMLKTSKLPGLLIFEKDAIIYATTRVKQENWNPVQLIVLSPRHPVTRLILRGLHEIDPRGVMHTVSCQIQNILLDPSGCKNCQKNKS